MKKEWTKEEEQYLISNAKLPDKDIALFLQRTTQSVKNKKRSLILNNTTLNEEKINWLKNNYKNYSYKELANHIKVGERAIHFILAKLKLSKKIKWHEAKNYDKTFLAYFAGLIATDGHLNPKNKRICLYLQMKDKDFILNLAKILVDTTNCVITNKTETQIGFSLTLPNLYKYLTETINIKEGSKTYDLNPNLATFSEIEKLYFLRGALDGDGCVKIYKHKNKTTNKLKIEIVTASKFFAEQLSTTFNGKLLKRYNGNYWDIYWQSSEAKTLFEQLPNEPYFLQRKTDLLEQLKTVSLPLLERKKFGAIKNRNRYYAMYKQKYIGFYGTMEEAQRAYDKYLNDNNLPGKRNFSEENDI